MAGKRDTLRRTRAKYRLGSFDVIDTASTGQTSPRQKAVVGTPQVDGSRAVPKAEKDPLTLLAPLQLGKRRPDKRALSVPPGRRAAGCAKSRKGSFDVIGTVPKAPKDPLTLLAPLQLGKRRRDKRGLSVPPGRRLAGCAKSRKGSFDVRGAAPTGQTSPRQKGVIGTPR